MSSKDSSSHQSRLLSRLQRLLSEENYYEALQLYLTLYARYLSSRGAQEAGDLLYEAAQVFLSRGQLESAEELIMKWAEHLRTHTIPTSEREIARILEIAKHFPVGQKEAAPIIKFMRLCIKWSQENGDTKTGDATLHNELADILWGLQRYNEAKVHCIHGRQTGAFALRILDLSLKGGYPGETGLFITQAVLSMLGEGCIKEAAEVLREFVSNHPCLDTAFPFRGHPLLNYSHMIIGVLIEDPMQPPSPIERCQHITQQYLPAIQTDPSLMEILGKLNFIKIHPFRGMLQALPTCTANQQPNLKVAESEGLD